MLPNIESIDTIEFISIKGRDITGNKKWIEYI
jgi:hypothetical protein